MNNRSISAAGLLSFLGAWLLVVQIAQGDDWPQYLGPNRNGQTAEQGLANSWPESGPKVLWTFQPGEGFGGAAVRDGEVYLLDRVNDANDVLRCFDLNTGKEQWNCSFPAPGKVSHNGSRAVPTIEESVVYAVGMMGNLYAVSRETHQALWQKDLAKEFPPVSNLTWGYAQSPSVHNDLLILAPQSSAGFVVALNKQTGDLVWKSGGFGDAGYSSPVIHEIAGLQQAVMISGGPNGGVMGLSLEDGRELWRYTNWQCQYPIPHTTLLPGNRLFITGEYGAGSALIQINREGEAFSVEELALLPDIESQIHPPLLIDGYLYINCNGNRRNDGMACFTLDGKILWKTKDTPEAPRFERGSLIYAGDRIINLDGKTGALHLVDPSPEGYKELTSASVLKGRQMWAPLALADGKLLLRSMDELRCIDLRNPG